MVNSVNTNSGAMIALQSLNKTNAELAVTQKQVSTGFRVADSSDDGAAFAIAQSVRSTVGALTTANQQLSSSQGLLSTTNTALTRISTTMASMRQTLVSLADGNITGDARIQDTAKYNKLSDQVKAYVKDASYNGSTLIGNITQSTGTYSATGRVSVVSNEAGATIGFAGVDGSALYGSLALTGTATGATGVLTQGAAAAMLSVPSVGAGFTSPGLFARAQSTVGAALNTVGMETNQVKNQVSYNSDKIDSLNTGLGSMVDADLAKESAQLTALQIRQQLGTQALSLANQAPQSLLSLFK